MSVLSSIDFSGVGTTSKKAPVGANIGVAPVYVKRSSDFRTGIRHIEILP
jgi:hypothetical protein